MAAAAVAVEATVVREAQLMEMSRDGEGGREGVEGGLRFGHLAAVALPLMILLNMALGVGGGGWRIAAAAWEYGEPHVGRWVVS